MDYRPLFDARRIKGKPFWAYFREQVSKKSFKELIIMKPYRKPTQVDKRKYAKVNV